MQSKEKLFSITASDFEWSYTRGTGKGGQKKNKTNSAVHCVHPPSGSHGYSEATRSQTANKTSAWNKCISNEVFKRWLQYEMMKRCGILSQIDAIVDKEMEKVLIEGKDENGRWVKI